MSMIVPDVLTFPVVPDLHPPDGVRAANAVIVRHHQLQAHSLHQVISLQLCIGALVNCWKYREVKLQSQQWCSK